MISICTFWILEIPFFHFSIHRLDLQSLKQHDTHSPRMSYINIVIAQALYDLPSTCDVIEASKQKSCAYKQWRQRERPAFVSYRILTYHWHSTLEIYEYISRYTYRADIRMENILIWCRCVCVCFRMYVSLVWVLCSLHYFVLKSDSNSGFKQ